MKMTEPCNTIRILHTEKHTHLPLNLSVNKNNISSEYFQEFLFVKAKEDPWPSACFYTPQAHLSATAGFLIPRSLFPKQHVFTALCTSDPCSQPCFIQKEAAPHPPLRNPLAHSCSASLTSLSHWVGIICLLGLAGFHAWSAHSPRCHSKLLNTQASPSGQKLFQFSKNTALQNLPSHQEQ